MDKFRFDWKGCKEFPGFRTFAVEVAQVLPSADDPGIKYGILLAGDPFNPDSIIDIFFAVIFSFGAAYDRQVNILISLGEPLVKVVGPVSGA
jgi:hypothetical protein